MVLRPISIARGRLAEAAVGLDVVAEWERRDAHGTPLRRQGLMLR